MREAACRAHLRRDFDDLWTSTQSEIAREALDRIGKRCDIGRDLNGQPADVRHATRQRLSKPKVEAFFAWSEQQLRRIPGKSDLAKAFRYGLSRQEAFSLFLTDGRVAIDNDPAERALRPIGTGRKNRLFAGADAGAETLARAMTIIETAKLDGLDPQACLAHILDRLHDHEINRLDELLPWNCAPSAAAENSQAAQAAVSLARLRLKRSVPEKFFRVKMCEIFRETVEAQQADLDVWLVHYNTERPHPGCRNQGRRPIEIVISFVSQEG